MSNPGVSKPVPRYRRRHPGSNLLLFCGIGALVVGFMGMALYGGLQTFVETELAHSAMNAAMTGAAAYYSGVDSGTHRPIPNATSAQALAGSTFAAIVNSSSLKGFNATLVSATSNDATDSITVTARAGAALPFLRALGIQSLETTATATARALRYEPTLFTGPLSIQPTPGDLASYSQSIQLEFPLVDGPGGDLYVEQNMAMQQAYVVEGCNETECYNLAGGAFPVGSSKVVTLIDGTRAIVGSAIIDLAQAGVRKASVLRFVHGNNFSVFNAGVLQTANSTNPLVIQRVMLFGYAGACVDDKTCAIPAGFVPVE